MVGSASHFVSRNALERCTTVQPLYTRFADRICTSFSETTMRPNPNVGARTCRPPAQTAPPWPSPPAALCRPHLLSGLTDTSLANRRPHRPAAPGAGPPRPPQTRAQGQTRERARGLSAATSRERSALKDPWTPPGAHIRRMGGRVGEPGGGATAVGCGHASLLAELHTWRSFFWGDSIKGIYCDIRSTVLGHTSRSR